MVALKLELSSYLIGVTDLGIPATRTPNALEMRFTDVGAPVLGRRIFARFNREIRHLQRSTTGVLLSRVCLGVDYQTSIIISKVCLGVDYQTSIIQWSSRDLNMFTTRSDLGCGLGLALASDGSC